MRILMNELPQGAPAVNTAAGAAPGAVFCCIVVYHKYDRAP